MTPYLTDILSQPAVLRQAVQAFSDKPLNSVIESIKRGAFDRILITGMGASYNAAYPAYLELSNLSLPVSLVNAAELVHYLGGLIGERTLLWINSQSGRSAELLHLLEKIKSAPPACLLACVNDETSPLAAAAQICLPVYAGPEATVSTKTYTNTLAVNLLVSGCLTGDDLASRKSDFLAASDAMENWLGDWQARARQLDGMLGQFEELFLLGRGASMGAVWNGALINKEAAKCAFEGMHAADFRHGPLELALPGFCALLFSGPPQTADLNHALARDIAEHGGRVIWLNAATYPHLPTFLLPPASDLARPLVEILPMQLLTLVMARRKGVTAGEFNIIGKVTTTE